METAAFYETVRKRRANGRADPSGAAGGEDTASRGGPRVFSAPDLMALRLPLLRWTVRELLPQGYCVFAGPPKLGKTWIGYGLAVAVASGAELWGQATDCGDVLFLSLEDSERRVQDRLRRVLGSRPAPPRLHVATAWPRLDEGGLEAIEDWAGKLGGAARLVILDTLQRVRPPSARGANAYEADYDLHAKLHALARRTGVALVAVTHMRKGSGAGDWLEGVTGSTGITGAADTVWALRRERGGDGATLHVTGRDAADQELALTFENGLWHCLGDARHVRLTETRRAIMDALAGAQGPLSPRQVADASGVNYPLTKQTLLRMANDGLVENRGGRYARRAA